MPSLAAAAALSAAAIFNEPGVPLVDFTGLNPRTRKTWRQQNDPVMGGASRGNFTIVNGVEDFGRLDGVVNNIPSLGVPGFIRSIGNGEFDSAVGTTHFEFKVRSSSPDYQGYRISFGTDIFPILRSYKADFFLEGSDWQVISIPYNEFTNDWDFATGDPITLCKDNPLVCPNDIVLTDMREVSVWAEGKLGEITLDVEWMRAGYGFDDEKAASEE